MLVKGGERLAGSHVIKPLGDMMELHSSGSIASNSGPGPGVLWRVCWSPAAEVFVVVVVIVVDCVFKGVPTRSTGLDGSVLSFRAEPVPPLTSMVAPFGLFSAAILDALDEVRPVLLDAIRNATWPCIWATADTRRLMRHAACIMRNVSPYPMSSCHSLQDGLLQQSPAMRLSGPDH
ncbi:hypothetical protein QC762_0039280 [Podospora pseudocomata]|uniref:Uncharacterized protein n=1 Tax=Podospora pseudocomata TaxID=2093779 RepID=A0ABR0GMG0_9PEZI|nr:hypothetical protein QC762_0039280 [Podospora pseudocomata]